MPIGLTAKIEPKNDGFVGMVDADQIIGASGNGGYLPSSAISGVREYQLKISNSPSDGYYLQYKDSSDELTWAQVTGGDSSGSAAYEWLQNSGAAYESDVAWSGASDFYGFSSNVSDDITSLFSTSSAHDSRIDALEAQEPSSWSGAAEFYSFSSNVKDDLTSLFNTSSSHDSRLDSLESQDEFVSENYITSANAIDRFADSSNYSSHKGDSTIHFTLDSIQDDFYPSSLGKSNYAEFTGHSGNTDIHFPSSSLVAWLDNIYEPIGASGTAWSGASEFYGFSSNVSSDITSLYSTSSAHDSRLDDLEDNDEFEHEYYIKSSNAISRFTDSSNVNWTKITAISSGFDGRLDTLEAQEVTSWSGATGYLGHSSNADIHFPSSNLTSWLDNRYATSGGTGGNYWYSSNGLYYPGEIRVGPKASTDAGEYSLQVMSGSSYFSGQIIIIGNEISGLAAPVYPSSAVNKAYVDSDPGFLQLGGENANQDIDVGLYSIEANLCRIGGGINTFSGQSYLSGNTTLREGYSLIVHGADISGVKTPTYPSAAANKAYVDLIATSSGLAWSGATDYYSFSSNARILYYPSSLGKSLMDFSSNSINLYYSSSLGASLSAFSSNSRNLYTASSQVNRNYIDNVSSNTLANTNFSSNAKGLYHPSGYGTFAYISTQAISGVHAHDVKMDSIGNTIYDNLCLYNSLMDAATLLSGGAITRTAACTGAINVGRSIVYLKEGPNDIDEGWLAEIEASSNIYLEAGTNYIYADYNSGSPKYGHQQSASLNKNSQIPIGQVYNDTTTGTIPQLHIFQGGYRFPALGKQAQQRFREVYGLERSTGLVAASSATSGHPLCLSVTAGAFWQAMNKFVVPEIDTGHYHDITAVNQSEGWFAITGSKDPHLVVGYFIEVEDSTGNDGIYQVSSATEPSSSGYTRIGVWQAIPDATVDGHIHDETFTYWYRDGAGGWIAKSGQTDVDPNYYDDGTGTLNDLVSNKYGVHWLYLEADGDLNILYGQDQYSLAGAEDSSVPATVPDLVETNCALIARLIIQQGETTMDNAEFAVPWVTKFTAGSVDQHNDLGGLQGGTADEYYHLTATDDTNFNTLTDGSDASALHIHDNLYPASSLVNKTYLDNVSSNTLANTNFSSNAKNIYAPSGIWSLDGDDIYRNSEVRIGHSDFDLGDYNFQVSGDTYLSGVAYFKGNSISGLVDPLYPSSAVNKHWIESNYLASSNLLGWLDGEYQQSGTSSAWSGAVGYIGHSSNADIHFPSSNLIDWLNGEYYPSSIGAGVSGTVASIVAFSSNSKNLYTASSQVNRNYIDNVSSNTLSNTNFSSNAINLYYGSSIGAGTSGTVSTLVSFSSNSKNLYYPSSLGSSISGAYLLLDGSNADSDIDIYPYEMVMSGAIFSGNVELYGRFVQSLGKFQGSIGSPAMDISGKDTNASVGIIKKYTLYNLSGAIDYVNYDQIYHSCITGGTNIVNYQKVNMGNTLGKGNHNDTGTLFEIDHGDSYISGSYIIKGVDINLGTNSWLPTTDTGIDHTLYGLRVDRGSLNVFNIGGGSWNSLNIYGLRIEGFDSTDTITGVSTYNNYAIYVDGGSTYLGGSLEVDGATTIRGLTRHIETKTSDYTATSLDDIIICSGGTFNITLPDPTSIHGKEYVIKNVGSGGSVITVSGSGYEPIDYENYIEIEDLDSMTIVAHKSGQWFII